MVVHANVIMEREKRERENKRMNKIIRGSLLNASMYNVLCIMYFIILKANRL